MRAFAIISFFGCWICVAAAVVLLLLSHGVAFNLPGMLALLAIAFALAPKAY